jgi:hypothetical protein
MNSRLELNLANEPSWVLEIQGLTESERDAVQSKYDRLRRPPHEEWITGLTPLFDIEAGNVTEFHDVSPFFGTLETQLGFKPDSNKHPPNTTAFQPHEIREWKFTKH